MVAPLFRVIPNLNILRHHIKCRSYLPAFILPVRYDLPDTLGLSINKNKELFINHISYQLPH